MDETSKINRERWNALANANVEYSRPFLDYTPEKYLLKKWTPKATSYKKKEDIPFWKPNILKKRCFRILHFSPVKMENANYDYQQQSKKDY